MRLPDWSAQLDAYLESVQDKQFAWGSHDCLVFTNNAVEAMTGKPPFLDLLGRGNDVKTLMSEYRAEMQRSRAFAGSDLIDARLMRHFGYPKRGMIVAHKSREGATGYTLGVVVGMHKAAFVGHNGLEMLDSGNGDLAWNV